MAQEIWFNLAGVEQQIDEVYYNENGAERQVNEVWYNDGVAERLIFQKTFLPDPLPGLNWETRDGEIYIAIIEQASGTPRSGLRFDTDGNLRQWKNSVLQLLIPGWQTQDSGGYEISHNQPSFIGGPPANVWVEINDDISFYIEGNVNEQVTGTISIREIDNPGNSQQDATVTFELLSTGS